MEALGSLYELFPVNRDAGANKPWGSYVYMEGDDSEFRGKAYVEEDSFVNYIFGFFYGK